MFQVTENAFVATLCGSLLQATYFESWRDTLEAKRSINCFSIFTQSLWNTVGLSSIPKNLSCDEILRVHACSVHWEGTLLSQLLFLLTAVSKFVWKDKPFVNFLWPPFSERKSEPLYRPSQYAVTLSPTISKMSPGPVLMREVPVRLCSSSFLSC